MKIAFFGYDFFVDTALRLVDDGHNIGEIFVGEADNFYNFNFRTIRLAETLGCPARFGKPSMEDILRLRESGCETFLAMAYQFKIPVVPGIRGLNLHPTLLPHGRGVWPLPWLLLQHRDKAGLTLHQLTREWDSGPIVAQMKIELSLEENLESLTAKLQMAAPDFVSNTLQDLDINWENSVAQPAGSTWPMPTDADRELDWSAGVDDVLRVVRAFGKFESTAILESSEWMVTDALGWKSTHTHPAGAVVHRTGREVVVAAADGYVLLRHFHRELDFSKP